MMSPESQGPRLCFGWNNAVHSTDENETAAGTLLIGCWTCAVGYVTQLFIQKQHFLLCKPQNNHHCAVCTPWLSKEQHILQPKPVSKDEIFEFYGSLCRLGDSLWDQIQYDIGVCRLACSGRETSKESLANLLVQSSFPSYRCHSSITGI